MWGVGFRVESRMKVLLLQVVVSCSVSAPSIQDISSAVSAWQA